MSSSMGIMFYKVMFHMLNLQIYTKQPLTTFVVKCCGVQITPQITFNRCMQLEHLIHSLSD